MRIRRSKADDLFSQYIRHRDDWTCQRCQKKFAPGAQNLHCAHIFSRRHWATRHDPRNAIALCFTCHQYTGENPLEFAHWCNQKFGETAMDKLYLRAHSTAKKSKHDEALRVMGLTEMLARLKAQGMVA